MKKLVVILIAALSAACTTGETRFNGTDISVMDFGEPVILKSSNNGKPLSVKDFRGKVVAVFFGYAQCPHICAPVLYKLAQVRTALAENTSDFQILFITVDPEEDTPEKLDKFVLSFKADIIGLTGTVADIEKAKLHYKVAAISRMENNKKVIDHTGSVFVYDTNGKIRLLFSQDTKPELITADIKTLLSQK